MECAMQSCNSRDTLCTPRKHLFTITQKQYERHSQLAHFLVDLAVMTNCTKEPC